MVTQLGEHYRTNIDNRFVRPALLQLSLDKNVWDSIDALTKNSQTVYQGFALEQLYREIAAAAKLVYLARRDLAPNLRNRINSLGGAGFDRVLRDMAVNNFRPNLNVFAEMLNKLYTTLVGMDESDRKNGRLPLYTQMPELVDVNRYLTE
ncbi:MAG: hypothetical protein LBT16_06515 [Treponema sp.]|nr:hypothetical protein [Treponema sp.]